MFFIHNKRKFQNQFTIPVTDIFKLIDTDTALCTNCNFWGFLTNFLQKFGQSERNFVINASSRTGSVPQVMELMNGYATANLTQPNSLLFRKMRNETDPAKRADIVFLSILSRKTTAKERELLLAELQKGNEAMSDLIWALLNTPEFFFIK